MINDRPCAARLEPRLSLSPTDLNFPERVHGSSREKAIYSPTSLQVEMDTPWVVAHGLAVDVRVDKRLPQKCHRLKSAQRQGTSPPATSHTVECVRGEKCVALACMNVVPKLQMEAPTQMPDSRRGKSVFCLRAGAP